MPKAWISTEAPGEVNSARPLIAEGEEQLKVVAQRTKVIAGMGPGSPNSLGRLVPVDDHSIELFRQALEQTRFSDASLRQILGPDMGPHLKKVDLPLYERRLSRGGAVSSLIRLFILHCDVSEQDAREALRPLPLETALEMGFLQISGKEVGARISLSFCEGLWLAHDCLGEAESDLATDHVLGPNPAAATLAKIAVRRRVRSALDVGTGCGVQALLCARHSDQVVAVDTNPRALDYTRLNARLNQLPNVDCLQGSLFEPVAGRQFDLIICNPPFVISPESEYMFRDSGLPGDKLSEQVVRAVPAHLAEGGFASVLCSWTHGKAEHWSRHLKDWVANSGCDAWLFHGVTQDPLSYAAGWNRGMDSVTYGKCLDRWQSYYERLGIEALSLGAVVLRRRSHGANWLRTDELPQNFSDSCSDHILRIARAEDHLAAHLNAEGLFSEVYQMAPDQRVHQTFVTRDGKLTLDRMEVELAGGLRLRGTMGPSALQLLALCDGHRTLEQIFSKLSAGHGSNTPQSGARAQAALLVRQLLSSGLLIPVDNATREVGAAGSGYSDFESNRKHAPA